MTKYMIAITAFLVASPVIPSMVSGSMCSVKLWNIPDVMEQRTGIPARVSMALFEIESNRQHYRFRSGKWRLVRSSSDAIGIGQVKQITADWLGCGDIRTKNGNARCAIRYLVWIRDHKCKKNYKCMIARYHDGHNRSNPSWRAKRHVRKFEIAMRKMQY